MPCNSDYMEASWDEKEATKLFQIIDEINGKPINPKKFGDGYDPRAYNKIIDSATRDGMVRFICDELKKRDVSKMSLEVQMWWRDHQRADREREAIEAAERDLLSN